MRTIRKEQEPASLSEHRHKPGAVFDKRGLRFVPAGPEGNPELTSEAKQELREHLWREQRGLCCYCCNRIIASDSGMRIEHWKALTEYPEHQLDYWNLMAACPGNEGHSDLEHCDVRKKDQDLSKNPSNPQDHVEDLIHYMTNGEVRSSDATFDSELGDNPQITKNNYQRVLNLNIAFLRNNRIGVLDGFKAGLSKRGSLDRDAWSRLLQRWNGDEGGTLEPFSPVVVWWIKKKLNRA